MSAFIQIYFPYSYEINLNILKNTKKHVNCIHVLTYSQIYSQMHRYIHRRASIKTNPIDDNLYTLIHTVVWKYSYVDSLGLIIIRKHICIYQADMSSTIEGGIDNKSLMVLTIESGLWFRVLEDVVLEVELIVTYSYWIDILSHSTWLILNIINESTNKQKISKK